MKKLSLLLLLFVFSCQSSTAGKNIFNKIFNAEKTAPISSDKNQLTEIEQPITHNQLESRDLLTPRENVKKIKVALLVPLSGKNKELGWHLFNAATLALFEKDVNHNIELALIDSKETPQDAKKAFQAIIDQKIKIVIGPIFSSAIEEIEKDARKNNIVAISLSNNQALSEKTDDEGGVFIGGILPETQIDKIVSYAISRGKTSFAVIAPNNQYGITIANLVRKFVKDRDGNFIVSEFYEQGGNGLDKVVGRTINSFNIPSWLMENGKKNKAKKDVVISESDRIYPQVIIIPESGRILSKIASLIKQQNKDERDFQLAGTNQWDEVSTLNDQNLVGGWFAAPESDGFHNFEKSYYQSYNQFPPRISSIVYDSVMAISQLIDSRKGQLPAIEDFTSYNKQTTGGFSGVDGLFRFLPNGLVQRNLAILQVTSGQFQTIQKPTEKFLRY